MFPSNLGTLAKTYFYDHNEGEWINGSSLIEARSVHAAGIVTDVVTDEQLVAVTGGRSCDVLTSTEMLQDGEWVQGEINESIFHTKGKWFIKPVLPEQFLLNLMGF